MKYITLFLLLSFASLQYGIWFSKGGWDDVSHLEKKVATQIELNKNLMNRNAAMQTEIKDLKEGVDAIAETAREELGYIQRGEIFYQIVP